MINVGTCIATLNHVHPRLRRSMLQPVAHLPERIRSTHCQHFELATGQISGVAAQPQSQCLITGAGAEPGALYVSANQEKHRAHVISLPNRPLPA